MYIFKYALKSVQRSPIRNLLIGFVILLVTTSSVVALAIRNSADDIVQLQEERFELTASLVLDRNLLRANFGGGMDSMRVLVSRIPTLTLDELYQYADSDFVEELRYHLLVELNSLSTIPVGEDLLEIVEGEPIGGRNRVAGQFRLVGYVYPEGITEFLLGEYQMLEGSVSSLTDRENNVLISDELAILNGLMIGDTLTLNNPRNPDEEYTMTISGIYIDQSNVDGNIMSWFSASANQIIGNYHWVAHINDIASVHEEMHITSQLNHTFFLAANTPVDSLREELKAKGLDSYYALRTNHNEFEAAMQPLHNLISFSSISLWLVLGIGGMVLLTINMINIRERKYEIGVLRAMGMKKSAVAMQFLAELVSVGLIAMALGIGSGSVLSEPVGNYMLTSEVEQLRLEQDAIQTNLGNIAAGQGQRTSQQLALTNIDYIREIKTPLNHSTLLQVVSIGIMIILLGSSVSLITISRYEPLKILSNRT